MTDDGLSPRMEAASYRRTRRAMFPAPLRGSYESLARQNEINEKEGLERILDDDDLISRIEQKLLVPLPASSDLAVNPDLPKIRRYCRPWTAKFLRDLARAHGTRYRAPLLVTSAVRTVEYQKALMLTNGNAASAEGDVVSPHLTGATIDIAKSGMGRSELGWLRAWLMPLQEAGKIDVEEEFRQACFHITVYRAYAAEAPASPNRHPRHHVPPASELASTGR